MPASPWSDINGNGPMGLWDPSKATSQFQGSYMPVGGSMPEEGHHPSDDYKPQTASDFYNTPVGDYGSAGSGSAVTDYGSAGSGSAVTE